MVILLQLLAQAPPPARTLPEPVRQVAFMALLGIALLGMLLIVVILLGGHWVRRWGDQTRRSSIPPDVIIPRPKRPQTPLDSDGSSSDSTHDHSP